MRSMETVDLDVVSEVFGLLMSCPYMGGNPSHCQLREVRLLSLADRLEWAKTVSASEARKLEIRCSGCARCLARRASGREAKQPDLAHAPLG